MTNLTTKPVYTPEQEIARAEEARRLRSHPLLIEAADDLKRGYFEAFLELDPMAEGADAQRARLHTAASLVDEVLNQLSIAIGTGQVNQARIARAATGKKAR